MKKKISDKSKAAKLLGAEGRKAFKKKYPKEKRSKILSKAAIKRWKKYREQKEEKKRRFLVRKMGKAVGNAKELV